MLKPKRTTRKELINVVHPFKPWCSHIIKPKLVSGGRFTYWKTAKGIEVLQSNENELKPPKMTSKPVSESIGYVVINNGKILINGVDKVFTIKTDAT